MNDGLNFKIEDKKMPIDELPMVDFDNNRKISYGFVNIVFLSAGIFTFAMWIMFIATCNGGNSPSTIMSAAFL